MNPKQQFFFLNCPIVHHQPHESENWNNCYLQQDAINLTCAKFMSHVETHHFKHLSRWWTVEPPGKGHEPQTILGSLNSKGFLQKPKHKLRLFGSQSLNTFFFVGDCWRIDGDGDGQIPQQTSIKTLSIFISNSSENRKNHPPNSKRVNLLSDFSHLCLES